MRLTELALISQKDRRATILHEHTAILRALSMRDATRAVRAVRRHVAATRAVLEKRMSNRRENSPAQTCDTVAP
jgi:DNA-binding GntR family transcriptional regulator